MRTRYTSHMMQLPSTAVPAPLAYADAPVIRVDVVVLTDEAERAQAALESQRRMRLAGVWARPEDEEEF